MRSLLYGSLVALSLFAMGDASPTAAQQTSNPLRVFFDCSGRSCSEQFYRTEIDWVDWVRQREDADVHVIVASQQNASGGQSFDIRFLGLGELEGANDELVYSSLGTDVDQERLDGIARVLAVGFARYATLLGAPEGFTIAGTRTVGVDPADRVVGADEVVDPWNLWSFRVSGDVEIDGEDTRTSRDIGASFSADRVSPTWILGFGLEYANEFQEIERSDGSIFQNTQEDWSVDSEIVYALADHWSVGVVTAAGKLPRENQTFRMQVRPGVEYSYFPYSEATRRALTLHYEVGPTHREYEETTVYGETEETRFEQQIRLEFSQRQPWGDASANVEGSQYLHDSSLYAVSFTGNVEFRLFRGLSLAIQGNYSFGDNQLYLSADGESDEEILLELRRRQSNERYGFEVGFNYRFGSIYNNVVNNRFNGRSGGGGGGGGGGG